MENEIIYLDRNENNYGPAPACYDVLRTADFTKLSYYSRTFNKGVKSNLSQKLADTFEIPEERVLLGYGAEDLLKQTIQCYLDEGERLLIPSYSWWYYQAIADEVGGVNVEYPIVKGKDSFEYDIDALLEIYNKEKPKVVFISTPNNPTGNKIEIDQLERVLDNTADAVVVLDEAYLYFNLNTDEKIIEYIKKYPNILVLRTFSKYYALAGARIGFGLAGEGLEKLIKYSHRYLGFHRLSDKLALAALDSPEYYQEITNKMEADKETFYNELNALDGFNVFKSYANFILVEIEEQIKEPLKKFLTERNLIIKFMNEPVLNHHLRITLGTQEQNRLLLDAIKEFMSVYSA